jgi:glycine/D-amino acid oxidase-like deaminating enzyme
MIRTDHLILATGYESQQYLPTPILELDSTYAVVSQRMDQRPLWHENALIWETAEPYHYLRTTPDNRIIIGGEDEPFRDPKRRDALLAKKTARLVKYFNTLFPDMLFEPEFEWCGTFGSTKDGLPYIDRDERTGAWVVLGMGGNGITFSQVGARIVVDSILRKPCADAALFTFDR